MARWYLTEKCYLNVEAVHGQPIEWEYKETNRDTGRQAVKRVPVPLHLDPDDPLDINDKENGWIVVSDGNKARPRDIIFKGPPSPSMMPIDEDAERISRESSFGEHPIESLSGTYSQSILNDLERQILEAAKAQPKTEGFAKGIDPDAFKALQDQVAELVKQNSMLIAALTGQKLSVDTPVPQAGSDGAERRA